MPSCEFCQKDFSTKGTLLSHQKTAKYCLEIQGKNVGNNSNFKCEYCDKTFTLKHNLNDHFIIDRSPHFSKLLCDISGLHIRTLVLDVGTIVTRV